MSTEQLHLEVTNCTAAVTFDLKPISAAGNEQPCQLTAASRKLSFIVDFFGCKLNFMFSDTKTAPAITSGTTGNPGVTTGTFFVYSALFTTANIQQFTHTENIIHTVD